MFLNYRKSETDVYTDGTIVLKLEIKRLSRWCVCTC